MRRGHKFKDEIKRRERGIEWKISCANPLVLKCLHCGQLFINNVRANVKIF